MSHSGRIACPRCGANNFETVSACWKCSTPLGTGAHAAPGGQAAPQSAAQVHAAPSQPMYSAREERAPTYSPPVAQYVPAGDPATATRAAILLALTIPWVGLPAGWLFMMVENPKTQRVGRICANWSAVALVVHILITGIMFQGAVSSLKSLIPLMQQMRQGGGQGMPGGGAQGLPGE